MDQLQTATLSAIVATSRNWVIGKDNRLPWHLPADLKHFKTITTGHAILMGRKTYESIGRPLPQRLNLILTRHPDFVAPGCTVVTSVSEAIQQGLQHGKEEIFVIGGAEIYRQLLPYVQRIYLTMIDETFEGDAYFPELDEKVWQTKECVDHLADAANPYAYSFMVLERVHESISR